MEEKQNVVLFPSLLRLDSLCRYLLQEEQQKQTEEENNDDKEWFSNNLWRQTLLPSAFQALAEAIVEEKGELKRKLDLNKCRESSDKLRERLQDAALKMKTHSNQTNDTLIHLSCDLVSLAVGIPLSPQRAANLPLNALKKEYTCNPNDAFNAFEAAQSILELPKDEVISFIAKQNGRFPLGLLSVARGRRVREEERSPSGPLEGNNKTDETAAYQHATEKIDYIPQVLMVSPFWIAEPCDKRKKAGAMSVQNAQKRVVESLKKLQSLNTWNENTQESKQGLKPIMESFTPFPTTFWLCNDRLGAQISEIELTGWMKKVESSQLIEDPELQLKVIHDNIRFIALRWLLIPKFLLVHFYTSNRRCAECSVHTPEGPLIPSVSANDTIEALKSGKSDTAEGEEHFNAVEELNTPRDLNKNNCNRCSVCPCRICKLMQCHRLRGMGGLLNFCRLRCLHMQYAYHLVCPTTVGNMMDLSFKVHAAVE
ncbi:hypothetical protein, conserved [Eimeria acervulina]|uniref:Uncharacterized protein n=1 Tax=Eimeria acervulina TaxID=5801 RepID=U6GA88_EIMAC|nr:hypothetical protein, conserved [Eimeria acervulina]CDI77020.1 hypothetical protein, conserved [Eimeria acervulina]